MTVIRVGSYVDEHTSRTHTVTVDVQLQRITATAQTIHHEQIDEFTRLSIIGTVNGPGRAPVTFGQCVDELDLVTSFDPRWDAESVRHLALLWRRWHLNDMRPGCAHQTPIGDTPGERLDRTAPCPETDYRWGSAWLVEPLPDDVIRWATNLGVPITPSPR